MRTFVLRSLVGLIALIALPFGAQAAQSFNAKTFQQAQAAGKTILVDVYASWCPVCRKQQPIIQSISQRRPNLVVYRVDFDRDKDALKRFRVQSQSTLIVFKGKNEVSRSVGDTDPSRVQALIAKGF
jgi:thiol-disulfide isomerase/thioredoxin